MVAAAVLAGGLGSRMGADTPKQFIIIGSKPIIVHTVGRFVSSPSVNKTVVAVSEGYIDYTRGLMAEYFPGNNGIEVICGGASRGQTLMRVLEYLDSEGIGERDVILTHDAVRPFINERIIADNVSAALKYGACNTCIPAVDTVFLSADGSFADSVPPRSTVFHAQTPQSFLTRELYSLCKSTPAEVYETLTDGCSVYTLHGKKVFLVPGSLKNIKITYPDDIQKAEIYLKEE